MPVYGWVDVVRTDTPTDPRRFTLWGCQDCGALVGDKAKHDAWHDSATTKASS